LEDIPLKIVGAGQLKGEIEDTIKVNRLKNIEIIGHKTHNDTIDLIKQAYCLVFSSQWYECLPITILEAFACGVPVIVSSLGAMAEVVEEEDTGLFFKPGDAEDLAEKIKWVWTHPDQVKQMGKRARGQYETKYTAAVNYGLLMNIYNKAKEEVKGAR
jgi:glycosyltransferase involved in cell wall biosynthesis